MSEIKDLVIPASLIEELVKYLPKEDQTNTGEGTITNPIDLSSVITAGMYVFSIEAGGLGRRILLNLQNSPYDEQYYLKGIRVDPAFVAEIQTNYAGEQVIVFKRKK